MFLIKFSNYWTPHIIGEMNDYQFKIVKIKDEFIWRNHKDTDETFIIIEGEMYIILKGVEHKPFAENKCKILVIEPKGVINTGDVQGELTVDEEKWI